MDIPIELFLGFIGVSIAIALFGFVRNPQIPACLVMGGMFILFLSIATDNIIMGFAFGQNGFIEEIFYDVMTRSFEQSLFNNTQTIQAEELSTSSSFLFGDTINCLELNLRKTGTPPVSTLARYGVYDVNGIEKYLIGTMNITILTTSSTPIELCNTSQSYTLTSGDRIGVKYNAGDLTNAIVMQFDANNPFDSTITRHSRFSSLTGTWTSFTANDFMGKISFQMGEDNQIITENILYEFTELPKTLFALIGVMSMLVGGLMVMRD